MGFHAYSSPYDWSRIAPYKTKAAQVPGGIVDLSVGSPVDPVPQSVREVDENALVELLGLGREERARLSGDGRIR